MKLEEIILIYFIAIDKYNETGFLNGPKLDNSKSIGPFLKTKMNH